MVTILSILLVAVLAIGGIYYGGGAFQEAQVKARAMTIIEQMKQINSAWVAWTVDNGGCATCLGGNYQILTHTKLVPSYLASWPVAPRDVAAPDVNFSDGYYSYQILLSATSSSTAPVDAIRLDLVRDSFGYQVCRQIHKIFNGATSEPQKNTASGSSPLVGQGKCTWNDNVIANDTYDNTESLTFRWRVF